MTFLSVLCVKLDIGDYKWKNDNHDNKIKVLFGKKQGEKGLDH